MNYHIDEDTHLITGVAGTGRGYIIKELIDRELDKGKEVILYDNEMCVLRSYLPKNDNFSVSVNNKNVFEILESIKKSLKYLENTFINDSVYIFSESIKKDKKELFQKYINEIYTYSNKKITIYACFQLPHIAIDGNKIND